MRRVAPVLLLIALVAPTCLVVAGAPAFGQEPEAPSDSLGGFSLAGFRGDRALLVPGGPGRDGIKAVDEPAFAAPGEAHWVAADTPVLGVVHAGLARAYPVHLIEWHQVVNDVFGSGAAAEPVLVSFDPIAGAPRAFSRRLADPDGGAARTLHFGVSGLLYNASFVLYDRETESLWSSFDGRAIAGPLAGRSLEPLPIRQEMFGPWLETQPQATVLERPLPRRIDYRHSPFKAYWLADRIPYPVAAQDRRFHAKEVVTGVRVDGRARAYLGSVLARRGGRVDDRIGDGEVGIAYDSDSATFRWEVPDGASVQEAYWFAWKAWNPETEVYGDEPAEVPAPPAEP